MEIRDTLVVEAESEGSRADVFVANALGLTRSAAVQLLGQSLVTREGQALGKSERVHAGQTLVIFTPEPEPEQLTEPHLVDGLDIIFEDADLVVINKPAGVAAHPSPGWVGPTVVGALSALGVRISTSGAPERQGIVHRLDVGTSGVMVVAKSEQAYSGLKRAFKERTVDKRYRALVQGLPDPLKGTIDAPLGRHPGHDWKFAVLESGRNAVTHYEVLEAFGKASLLDVKLETGRTHQIRVHFSALGHPCAGDLTYGANPRLAADLGLTRQWLHAYELGFAHPVSGEHVQFSAPYPEDLTYALSALEEHRV